MKGLERLWRDREPLQPRALIAVQPYSEATLAALTEPAIQTWIEPVLVGEASRIRAGLERLGRATAFTDCLIDSREALPSALKELADRPGGALMKGEIPSGDFLAGLIQGGLVRPGRLISHLAVFARADGAPLFITDPSVFIQPTLEQKARIVENAIDALRSLGYRSVRIAVLSSTEKENQRIPSSLDAARLSERFQGREGVFVEGPMALDMAVSEAAARAKNTSSAVAGKADVLVVPDLDAGNLLCKGLNFLAGLPGANLIAGTQCPVVFTSRSAGSAERLRSIRLALACREL